MLLSYAIQESIRMIREMQNAKRSKEYRQITQQAEIDVETKRQMKENNWKAIQEELRLEKLYKYHKEDYIKSDLSEQYEQINTRGEDIKRLTIDIEAVRSYKDFFMAILEIEGDIEYSDEYYEELKGNVVLSTGMIINTNTEVS